MICQRIGCSPISIIGFGFKWLSSLIRVPNPPANITTFIALLLLSIVLSKYIQMVFFQNSHRIPHCIRVVMQVGFQILIARRPVIQSQLP